MVSSIVKSFKQNRIGIILIIITSLLTSFGQLFWKLGQTDDRGLLFILIGFAFYGVGTILMVLAFRYGSFSVLHPLLACGYIFGLTWAKIFLNENISVIQGVGIFLIMIAVVMIGGGDE